MDARFNLWDDNMAYRSFVQQFLDTGTLYEPFSFRRVAAYGGASLLQSLVLAFTSRDRIHISDDGIAVLLALGLVRATGPGRAARRAPPSWPPGSCCSRYRTSGTTWAGR